jgi:hypothetical protein
LCLHRCKQYILCSCFMLYFACLCLLTQFLSLLIVSLIIRKMLCYKGSLPET